MLSQLTLRDFAVVSAAELTFGDGLTVVSGETGAGKSLLVDALMWLTGARADAGIVRHGAERAELAAEFALADAAEAAQWLRANELDEGGDCQIRRVIRADGGSRAWINGRPATLAQLAELGSRLLEVHGQHEHQALLDRGHQMELLDAFGQHQSLLAEVASHAQAWTRSERELAELSRSGEVGERLDYLGHQYAELAAETLEPADIEDLLGQHRRQSNATGLLLAYDSALVKLSGEDGFSLGSGLRKVRADLGRVVGSETRLAAVLAFLEAAEIQLDEANSALVHLRDGLDLDPRHLESLDQRLTRLHDLGRKHRVPLEQLAGRRDEIAEQLVELRSAGERRQSLLTESNASRQAWRVAAEKLSLARRSSAKRLGAAVSALMAELGMAGGVFEVELMVQEEAKPSPLGAERCEFLVSANPGQPPRLLRKVASGGELARISLAIEVAALGLDSVPTMIFDEVDSGIGGAVAEVVGQKLRALGRQRQVLCVTHLPQVAAQGHRHFRVSKAINGEVTHSMVSVLDEPARIEELARMLGGVEITRETRANAKQMLGKAQSL